MEIKEIINGFTIDVIASTSFGTDTDTNGDRKKLNPFLHYGNRLIRESNPLRLLALLTMPVPVLKFLNITHNLPQDSFEFFLNVSKTMVKRGGDREDLVKILKEANIAESELKNLNYNKLSANSGKLFYILEIFILTFKYFHRSL